MCRDVPDCYQYAPHTIAGVNLTFDFLRNNLNAKFFKTPMLVLNMKKLGLEIWK